MYSIYNVSLVEYETMYGTERDIIEEEFNNSGKVL